MSKRTVVFVATGMATLLAAGLAGCGLPGSTPTTSAPTPSMTASSDPSASATSTPTDSATSPSSPPSAAQVKATGKLTFFKSNLVSKAFVGTCAVVGGKPTVTLADHKNDFYTTVDLTIILAADGGDVARITGDFGEDQELIKRKLVVPDKGTSAQLVASGGVYRISGKAMLYEDGAKTGSLIPYSLTATCAKSDWMG